jgi:hypothetical protein
MYFTIDEWEPSSASREARRSFNTLRGHAHTLAGLSASFTEEAKEATSAYRAALTDGGPQTWVRFATACAAIARHGEATETLLHLGQAERYAWRFFKQIAEENADLLTERALAIA